MKTRLPTIFLTVGLVALAAAAPAGPVRAAASASASAVADVRVTVEPQVRVDSVTPALELGNIPVGEFPATVVFRIRSNAAHVSLYVLASSLEKSGPGAAAGDPTIPLSREAGVTVASSSLGDVAPGPTELAYDGPALSPDGSAMLQTERVDAPAVGQRDTYVTVTWARDDPGQAAGRYHARVALVALVMPE